jgi:thymidine phosphorylase
MKRVEVVPPHYVYHVWDQVGPLLERGLAKSGGEYTAEHLKVYLTQGMQMLVVIIDDEQKVHGAVSVLFNNYPNDRVAFITSVGGKALVDQELWQQFENCMRQNGATLIRGAAYESVARLWKKAFGVEQRYVIVEKQL